MVDLVIQKEDKEKKKDPLWIKYLNYRIKNNKNFLGIIYGQTGSGKSWSALSIGEMLNKDFGIDRVIFYGRELMKLINSGSLPDRKGIAIVWDEAGISLGSREWQSLANKMLNYLLQTFRHRCFILFFTCPYSDFLDSQTRKLFHAEFKTASINYKTRKVKLIPKLLQYNSELKKFYKKFLRVVIKGEVYPIAEWHIKSPSKHLIDDYEQKKNEFTKKLNERIESQLDKLELKDQSKSRKPLTALQEKIKGCWEQGILTQAAIGEELGKKQPDISVNEMYMRNKGYHKPKSVI